MLKNKRVLFAFAFSFLSISASIAQPTSQPSSTFDYVTVQELLAIDNKRALEKERSEAEKLGLIRNTSAIESQKEVNTQSKASEKEHASVDEEVELTVSEQAALMQPTLVSIYGVGNRLKATLKYGGHTYSFSSGVKNNLRQNEGRTLTLNAISGRCISVFDSELKTNVKTCVGD